jgi:hypothetical protein
MASLISARFISAKAEAGENVQLQHARIAVHCGGPHIAKAHGHLFGRQILLGEISESLFGLPVRFSVGLAICSGISALAALLR